MKNKDLKGIYNAAYTVGRDKFFTVSASGETEAILEMGSPWKGKDVYEIGCGEGELTHSIYKAGANIVGVDYSRKAITTAKEQYPNIEFYCCDYRESNRKFDTVVMQGVLEHLDEPFCELKDIIESKLKPNGVVITSSPNFLNPRGYVWMTFQYLLDVEMSMADLHFFSPTDILRFCLDNGYHLEHKSSDFDWGGGKETIKDFSKRFKSESFQKKFSLDFSNIDRFLSWLTDAVFYFEHNDNSGANMIYKIRKEKP